MGMRGVYKSGTGAIVATTGRVRLHTVHLSHTATATATFRAGGASGTVVAVVRCAANDGGNADFKGGIEADHVTLSAGVCTITYTLANKP